MIVSNPVYDVFSRNTGTRNRGHLSFFEFSGYEEPDWLFFTDLNAHEIPNKKDLDPLIDEFDDYQNSAA